MSTAAIYFLPEPNTPNKFMVFALALAALLHAAIILGVSFTVEDLPNVSKGLEITIATSPTNKAPEEADFLAQENQQGSGTLEEAALQSTDNHSIAQENQINETSIDSTLAQQQEAEMTPVISTVQQRPDQVSNRLGSNEQSPNRPAPQLGREEIAKEIASLEAEFNRVQQEAAKRPRISRQNTASTKRDITAWYRDSWRKKVERVGNLNYPEEAKRNSIYGSLRLRVLVRSDGSIAEMVITESSGQPVLDQAAQRIVRLSAPFSAFSGELAAKYDQIEIIRTWRFGRDDFLTSQ